MNASEINAMLNSRDATRMWLVMEGDWGGQIYLTVRLDKLGKDVDPNDLLRALDTRAWGCNEGEGLSASFLTTKHPHKGVIGGMGGGKLLDGVWIHQEFNIAKWRRQIRTALKLDKSTRISH